MIPLLFVHFGPCPYAALTLAHARARGNEVVFLNPSLAELHAHPFAALYQHLSTNHYEFELACLTRWFVLRDWLEREGVPDCLYCDTDVLVYANVEDEWHGDPYYIAHDFTLSLGTSGHTSFWKRDALRQFCAFLEVTYDLNTSSEIFSECKRIYEEMRAQNLAGGVSDMLLLRMFAERETIRDGNLLVGEMSAIRDGKVWDHNINSDDLFVMSGGRKAIHFENGVPYGSLEGTEQRVEFKSLHFQGQAKKYLAEYAYDAERMPI